MFMVLAFLLLSSGSSQRIERARLPQPTKLSVTSAKTLDMPFFNFYGEPRSDQNGNIYYHAATGHYNTSTILAISAKESQPIAYTLPGELATSTYFSVFNVSPSGRVYVIAEDDKKDLWLFVFRHDGDLTRQTKLEIPGHIHLADFAVFDSTENMIVSGYYESDAPASQRGKRIVLLVASSGQVMRFLENEGDDVNLKQVGQMLDEGFSYVADDGNLYILSGRDIRVFAESGALVRTIAIEKPTAHDYAVKLQVSKCMAAVWFQSEPADNGPLLLTLETIDTNEGNVLGIYQPDEELGNNAVSFSPNEGFTFLTSAHGRIRLLTAMTR
jgi:hypothetical protein